MFEKLNIPLKLRKFQSGLVIIEDNILYNYYLYYIPVYMYIFK